MRLLFARVILRGLSVNLRKVGVVLFADTEEPLQALKELALPVIIGENGLVHSVNDLLVLHVKVYGLHLMLTENVVEHNTDARRVRRGIHAVPKVERDV